ncbi:MAG: hypothetical protein GXP31_05815 [Kiritimatiellaeota bacterium]|nr:hypothetical protein [Kiritimatiellota bacterium]
MTTVRRSRKTGRRRSARALLVCAFAAFAIRSGAESAPVRFSRASGVLELRGENYRIAWSAADGGLRGLDLLRGQSRTPVRLLIAGGSLWRVRFADGAEVDTARFLGPSWQGVFDSAWRPRTRTLSLSYKSPGRLEISVEIIAGADHFDLRGRVASTPKPILRFDLPDRSLFDPGTVDRVVFPQYGGKSPGIAFSASFFGSHADSGTRRWRRVRVGPAGYEMLFGGPLKQLEDEPPPVSLRVTDAGRKWFAPGAVRMIESHRMIVNRPPAAGQAPLVLVDSSSGPVLCGNPLGGKGLLLRFTGRGNRTTEAADRRSLRIMVLGAGAALARQFPARFRGRKVGLIDLEGEPTGGWAPVPVAEWRGRLAAAAFIRRSGASFVRLRTPERLRSALASARFAMILNPYGEYLPGQAEGDWRKTLEMVGAFVRNGGFWWELGGYPFFYEFVEERTWYYSSETSQYPSATADFIHLQMRGGALAVYGVQPLEFDLRALREAPDRLLVPAELGVGGAPEGGFIRHGWNVAVEPGQSWRSPVLRFHPGPTVEVALSRYAEVLGLDRKLADKLPPGTLAKLKQAVLIRLGGATAGEQTAALDLLPAGSLVHFTEYLRGGFDKQYPDHLPPRLSWGTMADLKRFYRRGHELGHLMMPYTNTSWWCIDPKGPTFEREGDAPLARRRDGSLIRERYAFNKGYRICFWHPAVRAADRLVCRQMTEDVSSDLLFQDQVGARGWSWDYNPVAPKPTAWISGLLAMASEDAARVPLATENGYDRVAQFESMLCGMAWGIVPSGGRQEDQRNIRRFADGDWTVFPILGYLAHDKAVFTLHDLGHFVLTAEQLAWTVGLGFSMSYRCSGGSLESPANRRWLFWLDAVQKSVCAAYAGRRLEAFHTVRNPAEKQRMPAVLVSRYAGGVRVAANTGAAPMRLSKLSDVMRTAITPLAPELELSGPGFLAEGPGFRVGFVRSSHGDNRADYGYAVRATGGGGFEATLLAPEAAEVVLPLPGGERLPAGMKAQVWERFPARGLDRGAAIQVSVRAAGAAGQWVRLRLPRHAEGSVRARPPTEFRGKPPIEWPGRSRTIAVVACRPPAPRSWVRMTPEDWIDALTEGSSLLDKAGFRVRAVRSPRELYALLTAPPAERPFAVVNPNGEHFVAESADRWTVQLDAIGEYVRNGGIWWETGGYSFYVCDAPVRGNAGKGGWSARNVGPAGAARLGFACAGYDVDAPAEPLVVTAAGRTWFGPERSASLAGMTCGVQRSFLGDDEDVVLVRGQRDDFVAAVRLGGWGWLWRLGGFNPDPAAAGEAVIGVLEYLATHSWPAPRVRAERFLWTVRTQ